MSEIDEEIEDLTEPVDITIGENNSELEKLYDEFNERFPIEKLKNLTIEEYTNLKELSEDYFCTWVERRAQKLGSIQGANSLKFGIYKFKDEPEISCERDNEHKYAWPKRYGKDNEDHSHYKEVFERVRRGVVEIAEAAQKDPIDFATLDNSDLASMFKWKVAFLYSKKRLLPIYSPDALKYLAREKGIPFNKKTKTSEIVCSFLKLKESNNIWDYSRKLWQIWDARNKDAYNDFPVERWLNLFEESDIFTEPSLEVLKKILVLGGMATCRQLSDKYGNSPEHYNGICTKLAGRIARRLGLELEKSPKGNDTRWKILFDGQKVDSTSGVPGYFIWKMKPNLKIALERYILVKKRYFVARITDAPEYFEDSLLHNYWRMQKRYDHKDKSVTKNLKAVRGVHKGDVLLLVNDGHIYAYGTVKEAPNESVETLSLQKVIENNKHEYFDKECVVRYDDCEAYYEKNYKGCNADWSQFIDVKNWNSCCKENPISVSGLPNATSDFQQNLIVNVDANWAKQKIKEIDEQFEKSKPEEGKMIERMTEILKIKKNIILQGAPGTGKTYNTAALALAMIGELPSRGSESEKDYHKKVMDEYEKRLLKFDEDGYVVNDGQIGFVTFHQSMDYEDFVEGIKPKPMGESVSYNPEDGFFKLICELAKSNYEDSRKSKDELNAETSTKNVFERFCEKIEAELFKKDGVDLLSDSKWKIRRVNRKPDSSAQSITLSNGISLNEQRLSIDIILRDYQNYKNGLIKSNEDIKPKYESSKSLSHGNAGYYLALFKKMKEFETNTKHSAPAQNIEQKNYVLIIDEINRGNVSKIFGELISLLEADKRVGGDHPLTVTLPYTKEPFSVPSNLYIIGTMNTTDRSVGSIDYAVRRRFAFVTLEANEKLVKNEALGLFKAVRKFLKESKYDMDIEDLMVGHSYFMDAENLQMKWQYEILPLLVEYHKDGVIKQSPFNGLSDEEKNVMKTDYKKFIETWSK